MVGVVLIYVLYWLEELCCICDCVVVLCDGCLVDDWLMVGVIELELV